MKGNNILGAIFISIFPIAYMMSAVSFPDNYDDFCTKIKDDCPDPKTLDFNPEEVYQLAKVTAYIGGFAFIGLIWGIFYIKDRFFDNNKPLYNSSGVLIDGSES